MLIIDAQLSPSLAVFMTETFSIDAFSLKFLNMQHATDEEIFHFAKKRNAIVLTKDDDFLKLLDRFGPPPKVVWVTIGNTSTQNLKYTLIDKWKLISELLNESDLVELTE
jgi:predicted nuclease of predicted toxin-antitoxin system